MKRSGTADFHSHRLQTNKSQKWFVYILQCGDKTLYTGITKNISRRIALHQTGSAARYTRGRLPIRLAYKETCTNRSSALKREYAVKRLPRSEKLVLIGRGTGSRDKGGHRA